MTYIPLSITLPTRRPLALCRTLDNLLATTSCDFEVIVVSTFPADEFLADYRKRKHMNLICVLDRHQIGPNAAHAMGFKHARGERVLAWVDDHLLVNRWNILIEEQLRSPVSPYLLGLRHKDNTHIGTCFGKYYAYFPIMTRWDIEMVGGWLSAEYRKGFGDVDLAMRVWRMRGFCEPSDERVVIRHEDDAVKLHDLFEGEAQSTPEDVELFLSRWDGIFGKGWDTSHLRGFNQDVDRP